MASARAGRRFVSVVVAGLDPAIHVFWMRPKKDVDTRDRRGHDD